MKKLHVIKFKKLLSSEETKGGQDGFISSGIENHPLKSNYLLFHNFKIKYLLKQRQDFIHLVLKFQMSLKMLTKTLLEEILQLNLILLSVTNAINMFLLSHRRE